MTAGTYAPIRGRNLSEQIDDLRARAIAALAEVPRLITEAPVITHWWRTQPMENAAKHYRIVLGAALYLKMRDDPDDRELVDRLFRAAGTVFSLLPRKTEQAIVAEILETARRGEVP